MDPEHLNIRQRELLLQVRELGKVRISDLYSYDELRAEETLNQVRQLRDLGLIEEADDTSLTLTKGGEATAWALS